MDKLLELLRSFDLSDEQLALVEALGGERAEGDAAGDGDANPLAEADDEQLELVASAVLRAFDETVEQPRTADAVARMGRLADVIDGVRGEQARRESVVASLAERVRPSITNAAARVPSSHRPQPRAEGSGEGPVIRPATIVAAGDPTRGLTVAELGEAMADHLARRVPGRVAQLRVAYPEDRRLDATATDRNQALVAAATSLDGLMDRLRAHGGDVAALVAAGGFCAPAAPYYELTNIATTDRPVRSALPSFEAPRGRVAFTRPATLADVAGGVTVWTADNDATPGDDGPSTKPKVTVVCGDEEVAETHAVPLRIEVGNFDRRTFGEHFADWYAKGLAAQARVAETKLLDLIDADSVALVDGQNLGAARDLLESWGRLASQRRNHHRMPATAPVQVLAPAWSRDLIRADLVREAPGSTAERLATADAEIQAFFQAHHLAVDWYLDGRTDSGMVYGEQTPGAILAWNLTVETFVFHPGAFLFLDGGVLNLGTEISDSTLNSTNEMEAFVETFEGIAYTGLWSYRLRNEVCVSGHASALAEINCASDLGS